MKRFLTLAFMAVMTIAAYATPLNLNVEKLFDGRYNDSTNASTIITKNEGTYHRSINVNGDPEIIKEILAAMEKDKPLAKGSIETQDSDKKFISLRFVNNGETIIVGLSIQKSDKNEAYLFISGPEKAFE